MFDGSSGYTWIYKVPNPKMFFKIIIAVMFLCLRENRT